MWPETVYLPRQDSISFRASSIEVNKFTLNHSSLKLPLNDSISALSVGLPGREKSRVTPFINSTHREGVLNLYLFRIVVEVRETTYWWMID